METTTLIAISISGLLVIGLIGVFFYGSYSGLGSSL